MTLKALKGRLERSLEEETLGEDNQEHLDEVMDPIKAISHQAQGAAAVHHAKVKALKVKIAAAKAKSARAELTIKNAQRKIELTKQSGGHQSLQAKIKAEAGVQLAQDLSLIHI